MADEFRRLVEQQRELQRILDPLSDVRRHLAPLDDAYRSLGIESATMAFLREEEQRRKALSSLVTPGSASSIAFGLEPHRGGLQGAVLEAQRIGLLDAQLGVDRSILAVTNASQAYESIFRMPKVSELDRFAREAISSASMQGRMLATESELTSAMASMRHAWLLNEDSSSSLKAFTELFSMGRGIDRVGAYDPDLTATMRSYLGDWRDPLTPAVESLIAPLPRVAYYLERGFDPALTDFTNQAFDEGVQVADLDPQAEDDVPASDGPVGEEEAFARADKAFGRLYRFEVCLRRFIEQRMREAYGDQWMKRQLPAGMRDEWIEKRDKAAAAGQAEQPLIDYADFSDYKAIIERKDNWNTVFKQFFGRQDDVRESFQRLFPVRIATMHARIVTRDDELLLLVETKRVLTAIRSR